MPYNHCAGTACVTWTVQDQRCQAGKQDTARIGQWAHTLTKIVPVEDRGASREA